MTNLEARLLAGWLAGDHDVFVRVRLTGLDAGVSFRPVVEAMSAAIGITLRQASILFRLDGVPPVDRAATARLPAVDFDDPPWVALVPAPIGAELVSALTARGARVDADAMPLPDVHDYVRSQR